MEGVGDPQPRGREAPFPGAPDGVPTGAGGALVHDAALVTVATTSFDAVLAPWRFLARTRTK